MSELTSLTNHFVIKYDARCYDMAKVRSGINKVRTALDYQLSSSA
jgi:hypothetical protein